MAKAPECVRRRTDRSLAVCAATVQVRHRNLSIYNRLVSLLKDHTRRFFLFSNEHNKDTYTAHRPGESPNDRNDRAIRLSASWYRAHLKDTVKVRAFTCSNASNPPATYWALCLTPCLTPCRSHSRARRFCSSQTISPT